VEMIHAFMYLPKAFFGIFMALFKIKRVDKNFSHTPHTYVKSENKN
jgi:hypothetical protein